MRKITKNCSPRSEKLRVLKQIAIYIISTESTPQTPHKLNTTNLDSTKNEKFLKKVEIQSTKTEFEKLTLKGRKRPKSKISFFLAVPSFLRFKVCSDDKAKLS